MIEIKLIRFEDIASRYNNFILNYFPDDEIKPLEIISKLYSDGLYDIYDLLYDNQVVAVAFISRLRDSSALLLDYFCVDKFHQSQGLGSLFLSYLKKEVAHEVPLIIETESISNADEIICIRRNDFYIKNDVVRIKYSASIFECIFDIWYLSDIEFSDEVILDKYNELYRTMLPDCLYRDNCIIPYFN